MCMQAKFLCKFFEPCDWSTRSMKVILLVLSLVKISVLTKPLLRPAGTKIHGTSGQCTGEQPYNCSKKRACAMTLDENAKAYSILPGSKNIRKQSDNIFYMSKN